MEVAAESTCQHAYISISIKASDLLMYLTNHLKPVSFDHIKI